MLGRINQGGGPTGLVFATCGLECALPDGLKVFPHFLEVLPKCRLTRKALPYYVRFARELFIIIATWYALDNKYGLTD